MTRKFNPGDKVEHHAHPNRKGTVIGYCRHGFVLVGFGRDYAGNNGHIDVNMGPLVPPRFKDHCDWAKRGQLTLISKEVKP